MWITGFIPTSSAKDRMGSMALDSLLKDQTGHGIAARGRFERASPSTNG
jgi:hypothetical protein